MDRSSIINLIKETFSQDDILQWIPVLSSRQVFCDVKSVTQSEWFEAGRNGIQPSYVFTMNRWEYKDEKIVEYEGKRYGVFRTYVGRNETIELHCEEKGGVQHGQGNQA